MAPGRAIVDLTLGPLNLGAWSARSQIEASTPVIEREVARMPPDAVDRTGGDWPARRGMWYRWWDHRRGPRAAPWGVRVAILERMARIAPGVYIYFDSPFDAPDERFDGRWEAVACALEDAVYAEVNRRRISPRDYARLRAHWDAICGPTTD